MDIDSGSGATMFTAFRQAAWVALLGLGLTITGGAAGPGCDAGGDRAESRSLPFAHDLSPDTTRLYLAQPRPGGEPELFAAGTVSTDAGAYGTVVFSPEGDEAYWVKDEHPGLFFSRLQEGAWTEPELFPFPEGYRLNSPFFSPDGGRLYVLAASRGPNGMDTNDRIWVVERSGGGWGEPRELDPAVNSVSKHFQFSVDRGGMVYFGGEGADLYSAELRDGVYLAPVRLGPPVNSTTPEMSPHISPDGSLLLFDRFFDAPPWIRIMASFRTPEGGWTDPVDLSPYTRSEGNDSGARLSPDGRYLFFQSVREGSDPNRSVYWMEAAFLDAVRDRALRDAGQASPPPAPPYLGESPPGATPVPFAHHLFPRELHSSPVFSPRGDELFWNEMEGEGIRFMRAEGGRWSEPHIAPFSLPSGGEPSFAPDGLTLYFLSGRRTPESQGEWDENAWRVTRTGDGWSEAEPLGSPVNDHPMHWGVSLAANGNLYFGGMGGAQDIMVAELRDGRYRDPVPLGPGVSTADGETTPEVAPDESFLVFTRVVENGRGPLDLYVSFRSADGSWLQAIPLAAVNTPGYEISPRLSPDGRYLFFLRTQGGELRPYWVSSSVITDLRPR